MKAKNNSYQDYLQARLQKNEFALAYLNAALEEKDPHSLLLAIKNIAAARKIGMTKLAQKSHINRVNLYKILSKTGNPLLLSIMTILNALGFKVAIELQPASRKLKAA